MATSLTCAYTTLILGRASILEELVGAAAAKVAARMDSATSAHADLAMLRQLASTGSVDRTQIDRFEQELLFVQTQLQPFSRADSPAAADAEAAGFLSGDGLFTTPSGRDLVDAMRDLCEWGRMQNAGLVVEDSAVADMALAKRARTSK